MTRGIIIVGAGATGSRAAISLRTAGYTGLITLIGDEALMPYDRPPLSKAAVTDEAEPTPVLLLDPDTAASQKIDLRLGMSARHIARESKTLLLSDGSTLGYDRLLLATGAKPRKLAIPGGERALSLRNFEDAVTLRAHFHPGKRMVIVGGGFIGLEIAASAIKRGSNVTVIEAQPRILMRGVPAAIADVVYARHRGAGVEVLTGVGLTRIDEGSVLLDSGREISFDAVIAGIGAVPETQLAEAAGLDIENGIAVNTTLVTSDPDIFAAGDCCSFPHGLFGGERIRLEAWRNAQDQGVLVAENMLGAGKDYATVPWFWSDQYDLSLQVSGLPAAGSVIIERRPAPGILILFHLAHDGRLIGISGIGPGNAVARDIKLGEMLIARRICPDPATLAMPDISLKLLLRV